MRILLFVRCLLFNLELKLHVEFHLQGMESHPLGVENLKRMIYICVDEIF